MNSILRFLTKLILVISFLLFSSYSWADSIKFSIEGSNTKAAGWYGTMELDEYAYSESDNTKVGDSYIEDAWAVGIQNLQLYYLISNCTLYDSNDNLISDKKSGSVRTHLYRYESGYAQIYSSWNINDVFISLYEIDVNLGINNVFDRERLTGTNFIQLMNGIRVIDFDNYYDFDLTKITTPVPEPGTLCLFGFGLIGFMVVHSRKKIHIRVISHIRMS